jgi:hypothetical protein
MDISTGNWFEYLREEVLTEGLRDIGLPEKIIDFIENAMANAPEKSKMYAGNQWKAFELSRGYSGRPMKNWRSFMEENFEDEIQVQVGSDPDSKAEIVGRVMTPYRVDRDVGPQERKMYDEETIDQNKRIAFVVQNVAAAFNKPCGTWRKTFMKAAKALSKAGVESEKVEKVKEWLAAFMMQEFRSWYAQYDLLFTWLSDEPTNYEMIKNEDDLRTAYNIAKEDLEAREDPENVVHEFDDGSYWYNLDVSSCSVEGERMGHCGSDSRGVLVSLRKRKKGRKASSSYVTMTWEQEGYGGSNLYQIKGRSNEAPPDEVWDHISWFINNMGITAVQEDGEHSRNPEDFREMLEYLQRENPSVSFIGVVDEGAIQEALDEVEGEYSQDAVHSSIDAQVMGPDEHGGEGHYIYMNAYCSLQINLGWPDIVVRDRGDAYPAVEAGSGDYDDNFYPIPGNTWGREARDFSSEIEIDNIEWELPGEGETDWNVTMLVGVQPDDMDTPDAPKTAHLEVEIRMTHSEPANDPQDAKWEFEQFAEQVKENFEDSYAEIAEKIRRNLVKGEFMSKTAFDRAEDELTATDLAHWEVHDSDGSTVEFWFRSSPDRGFMNNLGGKLGSIPNEFKMWAYDADETGDTNGLYGKMFGSAPTRTHPAKIENPDLNQEMVSSLSKLYGTAEGPDPKQQQLNLGAVYQGRRARPPWAEVLRSNSRFVILAQSSLSGGGYRDQRVGWKFEIFVDAKSPEERIDAIKTMIKYFNENPEMIEKAAAEVIGQRFATIQTLVDVTKDEVLSGKRINAVSHRIQSMYNNSPSDDWAQKAIAVTKWIMDNWDDMGDIEKYVGYYRYALPLALRSLNFARDIPTMEMDDPNNYGKPSTWENKVRRQIQLLGGSHSQQSSYGGVDRGETQAGTTGEPRPAQENIENQILRIDNMLKEKDDSYDLRLYSIKVDVAISKDLGGEIQETQTEIRGIEGVTTVRTIGDTKDVGASNVGTYEIKFELIGSLGRVKYRDRILIPGLMKIKGLRILRLSSVHRTNVRGTIRTVREDLMEYGGIANFGGGVSNLGASAGRASMGTKMRTPRMSIEDIMMDWAEGGVKMYDEIAPNNLMGYHVMYPVEELLDYLGREFRAPMDGFDGMYQQFIKNGPTAPVYVALGQNKRAKITGGEDIVWFAKRAGQKEVPVFFSYQRQV